MKADRMDEQRIVEQLLELLINTPRRPHTEHDSFWEPSATGTPYSKAVADALSLEDSQAARKELIFLYVWRKLSLASDALCDELDCPDPGAEYPPLFFREHAQVSLPVILHLISQLPSTDEPIRLSRDMLHWYAQRGFDTMRKASARVRTLRKAKRADGKCNAVLYRERRPIFRPAKPMMALARRGC
jgi:hypothetical protein